MPVPVASNIRFYINSASYATIDCKTSRQISSTSIDANNYSGFSDVTRAGSPPPPKKNVKCPALSNVPSVDLLQQI